MSVLGIIPARGGSKRIPKKNMKLLGGAPLISYTIKEGLSSNLDAIVVSSDDSEILDFCSMFDLFTIKRPNHLCTDESPTISTLQHALTTMGDKFDAVMTLQPTSPFRKAHHINSAIELFESERCDSLVSIQKVPHNFSFEKIMSIENDRLLLSDTLKRSQDILDTYARNGAAIYISNSGLIEEGRILGDCILPFRMNKIDSIDLDDQEDWIIAEALMHFMRRKS